MFGGYNLHKHTNFTADSNYKEFKFCSYAFSGIYDKVSRKEVRREK